MLLIFGIAACLMARTTITEPPYRSEEQKVHNINQVEMTITNYGIFGQSYSAAGCWWPIGSGENYIFGAGIWFGTIDNGDTLVTNSYVPNNGAYETEPGLWGSSYMSSHNVIYMYGDNWPAPTDSFPMAPQDHVSHQDSWCCFNDSLPYFHDTEPIGLEFYQTVYVWDVSEIEDIVFFTHEVKNVTDHTLQDCYIAVVTDCDIGNELPTGNDRNSGVVGRWYVIGSDSIFVDNLGYQWQDDAEVGWAAFPGAIGFDLLETPDDLGMTAFKRFTIDLEPLTDPDRYEMLAGYDYVTGLPEPYDTFPSDPYDQRFLLSSGPFDLESNQSATIIYAVLLANWEGIYQTPDTALALIDEWAQYQYDSGWQLSVEEGTSPEVSKTSIVLNPNPCAGRTKISFTLTQPGMVSLKLYNTVGQLVQEIAQDNLSAGSHTFDVDTHGCAQGTYFLILETSHSTVSRSFVILR